MNSNHCNNKINNQNFVMNKESYNNKLFDRHMLCSEMANQLNTSPTYFTEQYTINRKKAENIHNKGFKIKTDNITTNNMGYANFTDNVLNKNSANNSSVYFKGNYKDYINNA